MRIKAVFLDMDGTIVDAFAPIIRALNQTFLEFGLPQMTPEEVKRHTGRGDCSMKALFGERREEAARRFLEIHDEDYLEHIHPLPGAEELLRWLKQAGLPVAIVTSKTQSRAEAQLQRLGWEPLIDAVIGKIDGRPEKPDPTPIRLAAEMLGMEAGQGVMVGDGVADMKAAVRAGAVGLGICDAFSPSELAEAGASACFYHLDEVRQWIQSRQMPTR